MTTNAVSGVSTADAYVSPEGLTPDALMVYLSTRMNGLDAQIDDIFASQQKNDAVRQVLNRIKALLNQLNETDGKHDDENGAVQALEDLVRNDLFAIDPALSKQLEVDLRQPGHILEGHETSYLSEEIDPTRQYIDNVMGDLESSSQMHMIRLQSLMSSRQTAVSLSTNLVAALGETSKSIANNIGR
jgi:hypothetical protein